MTGRTLITWALPAVFIAACAVALAVTFGSRAGRTKKTSMATGAQQRAMTWRVAWRTRMDARPNAPSCRFPDGWVVTDAVGSVTALSETGARVWRTSLSNQVFEAAAYVSKELVVVASVQGRVTALRADTGEVVWSIEADARFQHTPLGGLISGGAETVRLVSQSDGRLFCFRLTDGQIVWQSEPTNRCDGEPTVWPEGLAYGNCDGAVYVFDAASGALKGSVAVGENDQMAGGLLSTDTGLLVAGTRQGNLVVVKAGSLTCEARVQISPGEAFLKPSLVFGGLIAMGTQEGELSFWRFDGKRLQPEGRVSLGHPVVQLEACDGRLFVLSGGTLRVMDTLSGAPVNVALGDEVYGLTARCRCAVACVADGAVVFVKGASDE